MGIFHEVYFTESYYHLLQQGDSTGLFSCFLTDNFLSLALVFQYVSRGQDQIHMDFSRQLGAVETEKCPMLFFPVIGAWLQKRTFISQSLSVLVFKVKIATPISPLCGFKRITKRHFNVF